LYVECALLELDRFALPGGTLDRVEETMAYHRVSEVRGFGLALLRRVGVAGVGLRDVARRAGRGALRGQQVLVRRRHLGERIVTLRAVKRAGPYVDVSVDNERALAPVNFKSSAA